MRPALAVSLILLPACSDTSIHPVFLPAIVGPAAADLRVNGEKSGTFACSGRLTFVTIVKGQSRDTARVDSVALALTRVIGDACASHSAPMIAVENASVPPGAMTEVGRIDLTSDLCGPPYGAPGCDWVATATVGTRVGALTDAISLRAF
jgi:hypothetical protein